MHAPTAKRWQVKSVKPTPIGANGVAADFSAAIMRTLRQRAQVMNICENIWVNRDARRRWRVYAPR